MTPAYLEFIAWKGRDLDKLFSITEDQAGTIPVDLSNYTKWRFRAYDGIEGDLVFAKDSDNAGEITVDAPNGRITIHMKQADTAGVAITVPDHGPYGPNIGPAVAALPFDLVGTLNGTLQEQVVGGVILLHAPAKVALS